MTKKGEWIVGEINMGRGPISPIPVVVWTVHVHKSPVDTETVPIPESRVNTRIVHAHTCMPTGVQTPQKSNGPTMPLWML